MTIKGERGPRRNQDAYVHKGISGRKFMKSFRLSEYADVTGADMTDGILTVNIEVILPEEKRPRKINIGKNEEKSNGKSAEFLTETV